MYNVFSQLDSYINLLAKSNSGKSFPFLGGEFRFIKYMISKMRKQILSGILIIYMIYLELLPLE